MWSDNEFEFPRGLVTVTEIDGRWIVKADIPGSPSVRFAVHASNRIEAMTCAAAFIQDTLDDLARKAALN